MLRFDFPILPVIGLESPPQNRHPDFVKSSSSLNMLQKLYLNPGVGVRLMLETLPLNPWVSLRYGSSESVSPRPEQRAPVV